MHFLDFFNVSVTFVRVFGYNISYIEFLGTVFGLISVWLATKANIYTWPTGIVNQAAFFMLFYQVQLYADMFLQVYFTYVCIYGWVFWRSKKTTPDHIISYLKNNNRLVIALVMLAAVCILGIVSIKLPHYFPKLFTKPPAYPFTDAFVTVTSVAAVLLMARKKVDAWYLWIVVDITSIFVYSLKGVLFVTCEYVVFLMMGFFGLYNWIRLYKDAKRLGTGQVHATS
jgi:nicotinamide mononucleotide transporter